MFDSKRGGVYCFVIQSQHMNNNPNNPLHGKTLESIVEHLVEYYGWEKLGEYVRINCFLKDPSIASSLNFLRKTPWAREKVEALYIETRNLAKIDTLEEKP